MSLARTLRTARHIAPRQLAARARFLWLRKRYAADREAPFARAAIETAGMTPVAALPRLADDVLWPEGLDAVERRAADFARGRFVYLNHEADFAGGIRWRDVHASALWVYQLHYLGSVADLARTGRVADAARIVAGWRAEFEGRWDATAWHPYPASLRLVNLCVAASAAGGFEALGPGVADLVATHAAYVLRHVEHDVRGNHILENARALLWAGRLFRGGCAGECERVAREILEAEIAEQVLADGGHFEMSPMYHGIVLRDLLEVRALLAEDNSALMKSVEQATRRMGEFLAGVLCPDGDIPLLGDSVRNFGPPPAALLRLAGVTPSERTGVRSFPDTGLHVLSRNGIWAIFDAGPVCPPYLPAHGQADTLTVEVWIDGVCVVGDPGVHDYSGLERAWGRSSCAHSTITLRDESTSEVYGSFRVGRRADVGSVHATATSVGATLTSPGFTCSRIVEIENDALRIFDEASHGEAVTRLHLAPGTTVAAVEGANAVDVRTSRGSVRITGAGPLRVADARASREFGRVEPTKILVQSFARGNDMGHETWSASWELRRG